MASKDGFDWRTGKTVYVQIRNPNDDQKIWNTVAGAFQAYSTANIADYDIACTEQGTASGYYDYTVPAAITEGLYSVTAFERAGGAPAETDVCVADGDLYWDGTKIIQPVELADAVSHGGTTATLSLNTITTAGLVSLAGRLNVTGGDASNPTLLVQNTTVGGIAARFRANNGTEDFYLNIGDMGHNSALWVYGTLNSGTDYSELELAFSSSGVQSGLKAYANRGAVNAQVNLAVSQSSGGSGIYGYGTDELGEDYWEAYLGTGNDFGAPYGAFQGGLVLTQWTNGSSTYAWDGLRLNDLQVDTTTTLTGAFTATNASNDIRLGATERTNIADALLSRDLDNVEATTAIHSLASAALKLVSKFDALTGITYRTNGTTTHMTQTPTTNEDMVPIQSLAVAV